MRILLIGDYPADERLGSSKVLFRLRDEFAALGHDARLLLAPDLGGPAQRHLRDLSSPWLARRAVARAVNGSGPFDVIDASSAEGVLLARGATRPIVIARSHGLEHLNYQRMLDDARAGLAPRAWHRRIWYPAVRMRLVAAAARAAARLIVLTDRDRQFAVARGWKKYDEIDVIPHGVSRTFVESSLPSARGEALLFCGSWDRMKGIDYLAAAFNKVAGLRSGAKLTILGPGVPPADVLRCFDPPARGRVTVLERCGEQEVAQHYRQHRALVMCSTFEGFGMVVPEALSQGLAVIATRQGAAEWLVADGESGWLVPERDPDALAAAMLRVLDDPALAERLGNVGRSKVQHMTWTATARLTLDAYARAGAKAVER